MRMCVCMWICVCMHTPKCECIRHAQWVKKRRAHTNTHTDPPTHANSRTIVLELTCRYSSTPNSAAPKPRPSVSCGRRGCPCCCSGFGGGGTEGVVVVAGCGRLYTASTPCHSTSCNAWWWWLVVAGCTQLEPGSPGREVDATRAHKHAFCAVRTGNHKSANVQQVHNAEHFVAGTDGAQQARCRGCMLRQAKALSVTWAEERFCGGALSGTWVAVRFCGGSLSGT